MKKKNQKVSVKLDSDLRKRLKVLAARRGENISSLIDKAVLGLLREEAKKR